MNEYDKFLESKKTKDKPTGFETDIPLNPSLFEFQKDTVKWALRRGRSCVFWDCGLGKTFLQLEWAHHVSEHTGGKVLILAPLAVSAQTVREGQKFGIDVSSASKQSEVSSNVTITNYEKLHHFDASQFIGIVLDESSILKSYDGKMRDMILQSFKNTPYKLACTATPAPNDFMELGNHAEFCGVMTRTEMLSMFFVHDGGDTSQWRLKGHAQQAFWTWLCSFCVMIRKPSDIGYDDGKFKLPKLEIIELMCKAEKASDGFLLALPASSLQERIQARRDTMEERVRITVDMINADTESTWLVWCNLNSESEALKKQIKGAVEVKGSDTDEHKEKSLKGFADGSIRVLVTKPSIAGFGMNFQTCHKMAFVGLSDSYEQFYQAVRRCWRFGQDEKVQAYIVTADIEGAVVSNIKRKEKDAEKMADEMVSNMHSLNELNIKGTQRMTTEYKTQKDEGKNWISYLGDSCETIKNISDESVGYSIFSPPFASLYTYSASDRDMGNSKNESEFMEHFRFLVSEIYRVIQQGRLVSFHCMNLPTSKVRDGYIGIHDFRGELIRIFEAVGFIFHSEVCIWKDPVVAMQRTKALGLLHKQIVKDSCMSRQGIPDYLVTMRKPGVNQNPVAGEFDTWVGDDSFRSDGRLSIDIWQRYASPVWMDINPSRTLQKDSDRDEKDERHVCPLQLDVIERGLTMWSKEGDTVLTPFGGIGSEGYCAVKMGRKAILCELKEEYYKQLVANMQEAEKQANEVFLI
jgi:superfamily II DNA or RNA helicase